jgi:hypothetical protein
MATEFNSYLGVKFKFDSAEARADIIKLLNDLDYFEKKLKNNFDTESIKRFTSAMDTAKQGLYEYGVEVETVTQNSYQNFRAIGQMDRITREFASGGLTQGLNGLTMFGNTLTRLAMQEGGFKNAISSLASAFTGPSGVVLGISAAIGIFELWEKSQKKAQEETEKHNKVLEKQKQEIDNIYASTAQESVQVTSLIAVLENENETRNRKQKALEELKKLNPEIFNGLKLEKNEVIGLNDAYDKYLNNLASLITLKIKQKELEEVTEKILKAQGATLTQEEKDIRAGGKAIKDAMEARKGENEQRNDALQTSIKQNKEESELNRLKSQQKKILDDIKNVSPEVKIQGEGTASKPKEIKEDNSYINLLKSKQNFYKDDIYLFKEYADLISREENRIAINKATKEKANADVIKNINLKLTQDLANNTKALGQEIMKIVDKNDEEENKKAKKAAQDLYDSQVYFTEQRIKSIEAANNVETKLATGNYLKQKESIKKAMAEIGVLMMGTVNPKAIMDLGDAFNKLDSKLQAFGGTGKKIADIINNTIAASFVSLGETIGNAINSGNFDFSALGDIIASGLTSIGQALISFATMEGIAMAALADPLAWPVALAAGVAAVAAGTILRGQLHKGSSPKMMAEGGIVSKPTFAMIGEGNESEAVMPLSKLGNVMNNSFNAGMMNNNNSTGSSNGQFVLKGSDLVLALNRSNFSLNVRR